jgi:hypothetical protein
MITMNKIMRIWIWLYNDKIYKAVCCENEGTITLYDENETVLIKRTGLTALQMKIIEANLATAGAKRIDGKQEPFTYL